MNYNSRYDADYSVENYNNFNKGYDLDKNNKKQGCCVRYIQEVCCYPSYYNEEEKDDKNYEDKKYDDKKYNNQNCCEKQRNCCHNQNNWHNEKEDKKDCKPQNRCCCCNRFFRW